MSRRRKYASLRTAEQLQEQYINYAIRVAKNKGIVFKDKLAEEVRLRALDVAKSVLRESRSLPKKSRKFRRRGFSKMRILVQSFVKEGRDRGIPIHQNGPLTQVSASTQQHNMFDSVFNRARAALQKIPRLQLFDEPNLLFC